MVALVLGCIFLALGVLQIRFPYLAEILKNSDPETWKRLGSPSGYSFADLGNTISLYSWILSKGFRDSASSDILEEGERSFVKARRAKYQMLAGLFLIVLGLLTVLTQTIA